MSQLRNIAVLILASANSWRLWQERIVRTWKNTSMEGQ